MIKRKYELAGYILIFSYENITLQDIIISLKRIIIVKEPKEDFCFRVVIVFIKSSSKSFHNCMHSKLINKSELFHNINTTNNKENSLSLRPQGA